MQFRTIIEVAKATHEISHQMQITMLGSCFAQNIGERLTGLKFNVDLNPFGIIFNPASIAQSLDRLMNCKTLTNSDIFYANEKWQSYSLHSDFSATNPDACLTKINTQIKASSQFLKRANTLIITWGTAWVYQLAETGQIVANCHKMPDKLFQRYLLTSEEIVKTYRQIFEKLAKQNPKLNIIITISPVRHLKDGAQGNQLSKAILVVAANQLVSEGLASYFPSYEIMLDDLRDYRFYNTDMVHPSEVAITYIFEKFGCAYFSKHTKEVNSKIEKIQQACNHRSGNPGSEAHKKFVAQTLQKIIALEKVIPHIRFQDEKVQLNVI